MSKELAVFTKYHHEPRVEKQDRMSEWSGLPEKIESWSAKGAPETATSGHARLIGTNDPAGPPCIPLILNKVSPAIFPGTLLERQRWNGLDLCIRLFRYCINKTPGDASNCLVVQDAEDA